MEETKYCTSCRFYTERKSFFCSCCDGVCEKHTRIRPANRDDLACPFYAEADFDTFMANHLNVHVQSHSFDSEEKEE